MMKKVLFTSILFLSLIIIGCGDDAGTNPVDDNGNGNNSGTITLSGAATGSYNATGAVLNDGDRIVITLANEDSKISIILSSQKTTTGTFSVPDEYSIVYTNQKDTVMSNMHTGSVKITKVGQLSAKGSFTASGYPLKLSTGIIDSSKVITIKANFSFAS